MAAGLGTRLRPLTLQVPKPLAPVLNRPIMEHIVALVRRHGMTQLVANLSHLPDAIRAHFGDGSRFGVELSFEFEEELLGTAGGVRNVADFLTADGDFFVMAGDALTDIDISAMRRFHDSHDGIGTLAVKRVRDTTQYGVVIHDGDGRVQGFQEKPPASEALSDLASCMIYMFRPQLFDYFPDADVVDFALDVFPALLEHDVPFYVHEIDAYWNDVGNLHEFLQGNFDALAGAVRVSGAGEEREGSAGGTIFAGEGVEIADDAWLHGPVVLGEGVTVGAGAMVRESVALAGAAIAPRALLGRAVVGEAAGP
jgi:mannose-1-phosphate guanylyltransferase/mannose-1-phosphate guanylyltransferase/phosphomannomutase